MVKIKKSLFQEDPSQVNETILKRAHAELKLYLYCKEEFWRKKASVQLFEEGDINTTLFDFLVMEKGKAIN